MPLLSHQAAADEDTISTDRPDIVDSSEVVPRGALQIELGTSYTRDTHSGERTAVLLTPFLMRYGATADFELRVSTDGKVIQETHDVLGEQTERGFADLTLGSKWRISAGKPGTLQPSFALEMNAEIPSGSRAFAGVGVRPAVRALMEWELSTATSLGVMSGATYDQSETHRFWNGILAASFDATMNERLRGFIEIAEQQFAHRVDGGDIITLDTGIVYLLSNTTQLDCAIYRGLNETTPQWSLGLGFSVRL